MPSNRRGLGRGLDALISGPSALEPTTPGLAQVDVTDIEPNPLQPRGAMDPQALRELADSIEEHGLIQPLVVTRNVSPEVGAASYRLIAGERRWQAAQLAGPDRVPVIIKEATEQEMLELALVENIQRADLNPLEEAMAYRQLVDDFGLTQEQVAHKVGRNRVSVTNALRLLRLDPAIQGMLAQGRITEGHARALLGLEQLEDQLELAKRIEERGLSVRQTEEIVRRLQAGGQVSSPKQSSPDTEALETAFREALGTKVSLSRSRRGGRLTIHFYSEEELQTLYDLLVDRDQQGGA
jgi:ParB family transcriptional regulator, chromosome partitioning protein